MTDKKKNCKDCENKNNNYFLEKNFSTYNSFKQKNNEDPLFYNKRYRRTKNTYDSSSEESSDNDSNFCNNDIKNNENCQKKYKNRKYKKKYISDPLYHMKKALYFYNNQNPIYHPLFKSKIINNKIFDNIYKNNYYDLCPSLYYNTYDRINKKLFSKQSKKIFSKNKNFDKLDSSEEINESSDDNSSSSECNCNKSSKK